MEQLPDRWLSFPEPLFWWAAAYDDVRATRALLARYFEMKPGGRESFEAARRLARGGSPAPISVSNAMVAFGWSAVTSGSLGGDEPI